MQLLIADVTHPVLTWDSLRPTATPQRGSRFGQEGTVHLHLKRSWLPTQSLECHHSEPLMKAYRGCFKIGLYQSS